MRNKNRFSKESGSQTLAIGLLLTMLLLAAAPAAMNFWEDFSRTRNQSKVGSLVATVVKVYNLNSSASQEIRPLANLYPELVMYARKQEVNVRGPVCVFTAEMSDPNRSCTEDTVSLRIAYDLVVKGDGSPCDYAIPSSVTDRAKGLYVSGLCRSLAIVAAVPVDGDKLSTQYALVKTGDIGYGIGNIDYTAVDLATAGSDTSALWGTWAVTGGKPTYDINDLVLRGRPKPLPTPPPGRPIFPKDPIPPGGSGSSVEVVPPDDPVPPGDVSVVRVPRDDQSGDGGVFRVPPESQRFTIDDNIVPSSPAVRGIEEEDLRNVVPLSGSRGDPDQFNLADEAKLPGQVVLDPQASVPTKDQDSGKIVFPAQ